MLDKMEDLRNKKEVEDNISKIIVSLYEINKDIVKKEIEGRLEKASFLIHRMNEDTIEDLIYNLKKAYSLSKDDEDFVPYFESFVHNIVYNLFCVNEEAVIKIAEKIVNE